MLSGHILAVLYSITFLNTQDAESPSAGQVDTILHTK